MYVNLTKQLRSSTDIQFYVEKYPIPEEFKKYLYAHYVVPKKIISSKKYFSEDKLEFFNILKFDNNQSFLLLSNDEIFITYILNPISQYNFENNILTYRLTIDV